MAGLGGSAGGAPAGVVDPRALKRGFAGVACPNRELVPPAVAVGVELAPVVVVVGLFAAPNRLGVDAPDPPNRPPAAAPAVVVGVLEAALPNRPVEAVLFAPPNRPPPPEAPPVVAAAPPPNRPPDGVVVEAAAPPNRFPAGFWAALLLAPKPPKGLAAPD